MEHHAADDRGPADLLADCHAEQAPPDDAPRARCGDPFEITVGGSDENESIRVSPESRSLTRNVEADNRPGPLQGRRGLP
jgi:hypothetical protein